jgi:hexosaminidase
MKSISYCLILVINLILASCQNSKPQDLSKQGIIPKPVSAVPADGTFFLTENSAIYVSSDEEIRRIGNFLADRLNPATGFSIRVSADDGPSQDGGIYLSIKKDTELGEEGYELVITEEAVKLTANKPTGLFRGVQTLRQLLPASIESSTVQKRDWPIATGTIRDYPTYSWRGSMLDVARHFFSVEDVKRYIDLIAYYKMNVLHLHLTDDQGWRIEIKSWPNLTAHGGSTEVGGGKGGFYTQDQYADIVEYAQRQYITIVPEIDLPGHINSALASYGELNGGTIVPKEGRVSIVPSPMMLNGKTQPTELYIGTEVGWSTLRAEKEVTFKFVDDVLREVAAITPGPYLHIGGDEASVTKKEDYITFIHRFHKMVTAHGKQMIGWEEISQGDINSKVIVQHWNAVKYAQLAAEKGSKLIMSPAKKTYLDMQYDSTTQLGLHWAAYIEVDSSYLWDPATFVDGVPQENILGVEAPLWSETVTTMDEIEFMAFPRLCSIAEIGWSPAEGRTWDEYKLRLANHGPRLSAMKVDFYKSKQIPWVE